MSSIQCVSMLKSLFKSDNFDEIIELKAAPFIFKVKMALLLPLPAEIVVVVAVIDGIVVFFCINVLGIMTGRRLKSKEVGELFNDKEKCHSIRFEVFVKEQNCSPEGEIDESQGIGTRLLEEIEKFGYNELKISNFILHAQFDKKDWYEQRGYKISLSSKYSNYNDNNYEIFYEENIPHVRMEKQFTNLQYEKSIQTHTSMKENEGYIKLYEDSIELTKDQIHFVDIPGHEKLRFKFTDFIPITHGIVFCIDSSTFTRNIRSNAEYLYDIFSNKDVNKFKIRTLIICNKSDLITALPPERVKTLLENEITRTAALDHQGSSSMEDVDEMEFLGYETEDFKFEHLENDVEFKKCSVENNEISEIKYWISDY
ncbi:14189_t:CDS:2 [Entrophospora sp. SA101]|nr:14189_t:CDS:2 [Entrophospora sp. SA101]